MACRGGSSEMVDPRESGRFTGFVCSQSSLLELDLNIASTKLIAFWACWLMDDEGGEGTGGEGGGTGRETWTSFNMSDKHPRQIQLVSQPCHSQLIYRSNPHIIITLYPYWAADLKLQSFILLSKARAWPIRRYRSTTHRKKDPNKPTASLISIHELTIHLPQIVLHL